MCAVDAGERVGRKLWSDRVCNLALSLVYVSNGGVQLGHDVFEVASEGFRVEAKESAVVGDGGGGLKDRVVSVVFAGGAGQKRVFHALESAGDPTRGGADVDEAGKSSAVHEPKVRLPGDISLCHLPVMYLNILAFFSFGPCLIRVCGLGCSGWCVLCRA